MPLTLYKSSAGSGKTYTLVREYIKLLVANPYHYKNILAITFTNKATEEMKHRIISALAKLADGSFPDLEAYLLAYFREHGIRPIGILRKKELDKVDELSEIAPTAAQKEVEETADEATELPLIYGKNIKATTIKYRCEKALQLILHNYSQFNVSTIDSFFQQVLRSFTKELKLPQKYEIEMNSSFALDQITAKLLLDIGRVAGLTEWLQSFAFAQIENDKGWNIERNIKELGFQIFKEAVWERLKNADLQDQSLVNDFKLKELHQALTQEKPQLDDESIENKMADAESEQKAKIAAEKLKIRNERYKELKTIINGLWALKQGFEQTMRQYGQEAMELIKGYGLTIKDFKTGTANYFGNIQKGNYEVKATLQKIYDGDEKQWYAAKSAKKENIIMLVQNGLQDVLTEAINYHKKHLKQYNSASEVLKNIYVYGILNDLRDKLIDFRTENNLMMISDTNNLLRLIISDNEAAFIFEKVGIQFKHVLIDEFQDTSDYQWFNLLPLVTNTLSEGNSALIVGDVKQSIYRWRGGNMHLLLEGVRRDLPHFFDENTEQALDTNYRSREHIVRFNNAFFETAVNALMQHLNIPEAFQIKAAYSSLKQKIKHHGGGYVKVQSFVDGQEESWKEQAKTSLINSIHELLETGFELRDIALLVRRNVEGNDLAEFLAKNDIKVISSESLLLKNSLKVQLLISVLFYLIDNRNSIARTEVLVHYLKLYPNEAIDWQNPDSLHLLYTDYSIENEANSLFYTLLPPLFTQHLPELVKLPLYALIEQLLQIFAMNQQADAYIQRFQDLVLEYNTTQGADIRHFLIWWTDNKDKEATSIIVPEGENAVTVMTIHKAKGLEFPVVFLPFCEWNLKPKPGSILWTESHEAPFDKLGPMPVLFNDKLADSYFWEEYEREILASYIDNLNMLYVAFTRPTDHLYIYTKKYKAPSSKTAKNDLNAVHKLLYTVLHQFEFADNTDEESAQFDMPVQANDNDLYLLLIKLFYTDQYPNLETVNLRPFEFDLNGAKKPLKSHKKATNMMALQQYISNNYQDKISIKSEIDRFFMLFDNDQSNAIKMGIKIHAVLEKLQHPSQLDREIKKLQVLGILETKDIDFIKHRLAKLFENEQVKQWFLNDWEVLSERSLLKDDEKHIPDRVIVKNNQAIIIDYKTKKEGTKKEDSLSKYSKQLRRYGNILHFLGYEVIGMYLLYIGDEIEIVAVEKKQ